MTRRVKSRNFPVFEFFFFKKIWIIAFFCHWIFYKKVWKVINFLDFMLDQAGDMW